MNIANTNGFEKKQDKQERRETVVLLPHGVVETLRGPVGMRQACEVC